MFGEDDGTKKSAGGGEDVVSVIGAGMEVEGDCRCEGSLRVDGRVQGVIRAGKSVVVGEGGEVEGGIRTQDAMIAGRVIGTVQAGSRVELKEGCSVEGDISSPSVRLEEGGRLDGELDMSGEEEDLTGFPAGGGEPGDGGDGERSAGEADAPGEGGRTADEEKAEM